MPWSLSNAFNFQSGFGQILILTGRKPVGLSRPQRGKMPLVPSVLLARTPKILGTKDYLFFNIMALLKAIRHASSTNAIN